ncbi:MAG: hypothetical protein OQK04_10630 [Kangiellaceae bacterium]|nr:hypothetical protein [Kangiellaceae bacterium]MCW8999160.1 hypothetical protein [Kangiellaceae bacterium]
MILKKQKLYKSSLIISLLFSVQTVIANVDNSSEQQKNASESNIEQPIYGQCDPFPECTRDNPDSKSESESNWFAKIIQMLNDNEESQEEDGS